MLLDTTNTSTKEGVANIADPTLPAFSEFLDERIAVVPVDDVALPECGLIEDAAMIKSFVGAVNDKREFVPRSLAEMDSTRFQPIPCAMLRHDDKILVLKRKKKGHPLHDTYAVWAGGHVSQGDDSPDILRAALERELSEEVFIKEAFEISPEPVGLLRSNEDARASRHIGVLYDLRLRSDQVALALNQKEFRETRGSSMSGRLIEVSRLGEIYAEMGDWSRFTTDRFWPVRPNESGGRA